ncbi:MAG: hypothetical protein KC505_05425, partial [Myxococcales bacterium]|nr:hypothetical protein [Myxococcales bacterium]
MNNAFIIKLMIFFYLNINVLMAYNQASIAGYNQAYSLSEFVGKEKLDNFKPAFLEQHGRVSVLNFNEPKIIETNIYPRLSKETVEDFFVDFAFEHNFFNATVNANNSYACVDSEVHPISSYFAQFIAEIKIKPACAKNINNSRWFLKEVNGANSGEIKNLAFLNMNRKIFSYFPHDIAIVIPHYFFSYSEEKSSNLGVITNFGVPSYSLPRDKNYFYLIEAAKGEDLASIFAKKDFNLLALALKDFAKALAFIHQYFMDRNSLPHQFDPKHVLEYYRT